MARIKHVTDRVLLKEIYKTYYKDYISYYDDENIRETVAYVPIDCYKIAENLGLDPEIVHGRLYYNLEKKYGFKQDNGSFVHLYALKVGNDYKAINFPLLSAALADLENANYRFVTPIYVAGLALTVSIITLFKSSV